MRPAIALLLLGPALASCRDRPAPQAEPPFEGISIALTPDPVRGDLGVEVRLSAARAAAVSELGVPWQWADTRAAESLADVIARDADGELPLLPRPQAPGPDRIMALGRPARGEISVRYRARAGASRFAVRVAKDRMSAVGHAFLLLPRIEGAVPARVRFRLGMLGRGAEGASSLGFGAEVTTRATMEELGHAAYMAGNLWLEEPDRDGAASGPQPRAGQAGPGPDVSTEEKDARLLVLGPPPFDGRAAYRLCTATMAATARLLGDGVPAAGGFTFMLAPEPGLGKAQDGAFLTRSFALWFDGARGLDPEIRLTIAHELIHRWVGGAVRLVDADGHDAAWFAEGFTVHFARRALLDAGLARPGEMLPDLRRTLGEVAPGEEPLPPDYRRGAQWAALLDASVRKHSGGARGLEHVVRELVARARAEGKIRQPLAALREALGSKAGAELDRLAAHPYAAVDLPYAAFGPCFRRVSREVTGFDLGFAGLHAGAGVVHEVVRGSAAERAGVREGMVVISSRVPEERDALQGAEVELRVEAKRKPRTLHYRPVGRRAVSAWEVAPCGI